MADDSYLDISDHDSFKSGVPHKTFERLRNEEPIFWTKEKNGRGFWSILRHSDILKVNQNYKVFSSERGIRIEDQTEEEYIARRTFQETDPPAHRNVRSLLNPAFSKQKMDEYESLVRKLASDIIDHAIQNNRFEAVDKIAKKLPMMMLGRILGVPEVDLDWLVQKGDALIGNSDPDFSELIIDKEDSEKYRFMPFRSPAGADLFDYAEKIINGSVDISKEGILFQMLNHIKTSEGQPIMSDLEFKNFFCLLVAAGNDTTRYSIAMAIYQLSQNKKLFDYLKSSGNYSRAADEFIRIASPTMYFRRTATCDYEMHEKKICEGDKVVLWFVSGNYDETVFNNPFKVDIDRYPNPHLSFGKGGVHFCLGTWLARMELKIILEEFCKKIKSLKKLSEPTWTRSNFICGVKSLDIEIQK